MARPIQQIKAAINADIAGDTVISGKITTTSQTGILRIITYIYSVLTNLFEQAMDLFITEQKSIVSTKTQFGSKWLRDKVFAFQYGDYVQLDPTTGKIDYAVIDKTKQIIKFCAVFNHFALNQQFGGHLAIYIRACKGATPTVLSGAELTALTDYVTQLVQPGISVSVQSNPPDYLFIRAEIKYDPRYSSTIQSATFAALLAYISDLEDGRFTVDGLFQAANNVAGVKEVIMESVSVRYAAFGTTETKFSSFPGTNTSTNGGQYFYPSAGVMIEETTPGSTWTDTISFTPIA